MKKNFLLLGISILLLISIVGCGIGEGSLTDGAYAGEGKGYSSTIKVNIAVEGGKISGLQVVEHGESEDFFETAIDEISRDIIGKESTEEIDVVSGATLSSKGIIEAINSALKTIK